MVCGSVSSEKVTSVLLLVWGEMLGSGISCSVTSDRLVDVLFLVRCWKSLVMLAMDRFFLCSSS